MIAWIKSLLRKPEPLPEPPRVPRTFRMSLDGVTAFVMHVKDAGKRITVSGWYMRHWDWHEGDYLILDRWPNSTTRYRIEEMTRPGNPHDQYFADCSFAPRGASID